jgi:hypothetical protein
MESIVQALPSSQSSESFMQPPVGWQLSSVQSLLSLQLSGVPSMQPLPRNGQFVNDCE